MMGSNEPTRADDIVFLEVLDAFDRKGMRGAALRDHVARTTGRKLNNSQVQGLRNRAKLVADIPCDCTKPESRDGGMPERWWA